MSMYFDGFSEQELNRYKEVFGDNYEFDEWDQVVTLNQPDCYEPIKFYKKNGEIYVLCEESEGMYEERNGAIYYLAPEWWYKVDIEAILKDYVDGIEIDPNEYRID